MFAGVTLTLLEKSYSPREFNQYSQVKSLTCMSVKKIKLQCTFHYLGKNVFKIKFFQDWNICIPGFILLYFDNSHILRSPNDKVAKLSLCKKHFTLYLVPIDMVLL